MRTGVDSGSGVAQAGGELDLGALGRALWAKKGRIIGLTLAAAALAFVAVNVVTPKYRSEARVLIETRENIFLRPEAEKSAIERGTTVDQEAVTSQVQLIRSGDLAARSHQETQTQRVAGVRPGTARCFAAAQLAELLRHHQGSDEHDAGRARAQELLRAAGGVSGREVARHRDRIRIAERRACRARRQRDRRELHRPATNRKTRSDPYRRGVALRRDR